jgi:hypothetical protein
VPIHVGPGEKRLYKKKVLNSKPKQISEGTMTNETTENFWKAWNEFKWPDPKPISYRLYYNQAGLPICYTMEDLPGKYIEVDREIFVTTPHNVKVIDGQLKFVQPKITVTKLEPNATTGTSCHVNDVTVVVDHAHPHTKWNKNSYETN